MHLQRDGRRRAISYSIYRSAGKCDSSWSQQYDNNANEGLIPSSALQQSGHKQMQPLHLLSQLQLSKAALLLWSDRKVSGAPAKWVGLLMGLENQSTPYMLTLTPSPSASVSLKKMLYITPVQSHLTYCSQLWRPRFLKDSQFNLTQVVSEPTRVSNSSSTQFILFLYHHLSRSSHVLLFPPCQCRS